MTKISVFAVSRGFVKGTSNRFLTVSKTGKLNYKVEKDACLGFKRANWQAVASSVARRKLTCLKWLKNVTWAPFSFRTPLQGTERQRPPPLGKPFLLLLGLCLEKKKITGYNEGTTSVCIILKTCHVLVWAHWEPRSESRIAANSPFQTLERVLKCPTRPLDRGGLPPNSMAGTEKKNKTAQEEKHHCWKQLEGKTTSNRCCSYLSHDIKVPRVEKKMPEFPRRFSHGAFICRDQAQSGAPADWLYFPGWLPLAVVSPYCDNVI